MHFKSVLFCLMCLMMTCMVQADFYQISDVAVQGTGENPKQAKALAIEQGQSMAFQKLMRRLLGVENQFSQTLPDIKEIIPLIREMSIQNEKNTRTDYWATLTFGFNEPAVQSFLKSQQVAVLEKIPPKLLLIPVVEKETESIGLEDNNVLYQFLRAKEGLSDFYDFVLPDGDLEEMVLVNRVLQEQNPQLLKTLLTTYKAKGIFFVKAMPMGVDTWRFNGVVYVDDQKIQEQNTDDWYFGHTLSDGWEELLKRLENDWRINQRAPVEKVYYAHLNEPTLNRWLQDKARIEKAKFLNHLLVQGVYHDQVLISYTYSGTTDELTEQWGRVGWDYQSDLIGQSGTLTRKEVLYE